jgi:hypothetical protein
MIPDDERVRYALIQERIAELEAKCAFYTNSGQEVPRRLKFYLAMERADAEEIRLRGHREFMQEVEALMRAEYG